MIPIKRALLQKLQTKLQETQFADGRFSLRRRLFVLLILLMLMVIAATLMILTLSGMMSFYANQNRSIIEIESAHLQNAIETAYERWSFDTINMSINLSDNLIDWCNEQDCKLSELSSDDKLFPSVMDLLYEECISELYRAQCESVFVILNTPNQENGFEALRIVNNNPCEFTGLSSNCRLQIGPSALAEQKNITLSTNWTEDFRQTDAVFFTEPMKSATEGNRELSQLYYWSGPNEAFGMDGELIMVCSIPILDENNEPIGLCGITIDEDMYKCMFSPSESYFDTILSVFAVQTSGDLPISNAFLSGSLVIDDTSALSHAKYKNGFYTYLSVNDEDDEKYVGYEATIDLMPEDSPYDAEQWTISVLTPKSLLIKTTLDFHVKIMILFIVMALIGTLIALYSSKRWSAPIIEGLDAIKTNDLPNEKFNIREIDEVLEYLAEHKDELQENSNGSANSIALIDEFLENIKTLSQAERAVFDLYVKGYTAKEIAEELFLSINTIKTHNKRIYAKLKISSREELVLFVKLLRDTGMKLE